MKRARTVCCAVLVALGASALSARGSDHPTIYATLVADDRTAILAIAAKEAGASALLNGKDRYTLFAPTDTAFLKLNDDDIGTVASSEQVVQKLLRTHLVKGKYTTAELKKKAQAGELLTTVSGERLKVEERKDGLYVGGVKIEPASADIECGNGMIHLLDSLTAVPKK